MAYNMPHVINLKIFDINMGKHIRVYQRGFTPITHLGVDCNAWCRAECQQLEYLACFASKTSCQWMFDTQ